MDFEHRMASPFRRGYPVQRGTARTLRYRDLLTMNCDGARVRNVGVCGAKSGDFTSFAVSFTAPILRRKLQWISDEGLMRRYVIESLGALHIPFDDIGAPSCGAIVQNNLTEGVIWLHSYVTLDRSRTFCVCDGPSSEAIRRAAARNRLPIARITEVQLLGPF